MEANIKGRSWTARSENTTTSYTDETFVLGILATLLIVGCENELHHAGVWCNVNVNYTLCLYVVIKITPREWVSAFYTLSSTCLSSDTQIASNDSCLYIR